MPPKHSSALLAHSRNWALIFAANGAHHVGLRFVHHLRGHVLIEGCIDECQSAACATAIHVLESWRIFSGSYRSWSKDGLISSSSPHCLPHEEQCFTEGPFEVPHSLHCTVGCAWCRIVRKTHGQLRFAHRRRYMFTWWVPNARPGEYVGRKPLRK